MESLRTTRNALTAVALTIAFSVSLTERATGRPLGPPFVSASKAAYLPGELGVILGYEYTPSEALTVKIVRPDSTVIKNDGTPGSDTVVADAVGDLIYYYDQLDGGPEGLFDVEVSDQASGAALATTVFADAIGTDLKLVGMPDFALDGPRGSPSDRLVDAGAGKCLVGTVDINATGATNDIRGFVFDVTIDRLSDLQPSKPARAFINNLETVAAATFPDTDTGSAFVASFESPPFYTTAGNSVIVGPTTVTSIDGTLFDVMGPAPGPGINEETYSVTVSATNPPINDARFEFCARLNRGAGDAANGADGFVTTSLQTGGAESQPINVFSAPGTIKIVKSAILDTAQDFAFTATGGLSPASFSLDDDADATLENFQTFTNVTPGSYTVTEVAASGYVSALSCDDPSGGTTTANLTATIDLAPGDIVTCTFVNMLVDPTPPPFEYDNGPESPLLTTTDLSDPERAAFALLEGVITVTKAKIHATSCSATVGAYPMSIFANGLLSSDALADNSVTVTSFGGSYRLGADMHAKIAFRGQKVEITQTSAGAFADRAVSNFTSSGYYNVANNMLTQASTVDVVGANGRPDRYAGRLIKDFYRGSLDNNNPEFYLIYDWGLEALSKLGYPANKYWQRSKVRRSDGASGKIVFVQDRLVGATSCRIQIELDGDNYADYVLMSGSLTVSTKKPSDPVMVTGIPF